MKLYQIIVTTGLILTGNSGLTGCLSANNTPEVPDPTYISGTVKSEIYDKKFLDSDRYLFSVETEYGVKIFNCKGDRSAPTLDLLINTGDQVKIKLDPFETIEDYEFWIKKADVVEINGQIF